MYASSLVKQLPTEVLKRLLMRPALKALRTVSTPMDHITTNRKMKAAIGVGSAAAIAAGGTYADQRWKDDLPTAAEIGQKVQNTTQMAKEWVKKWF